MKVFIYRSCLADNSQSRRILTQSYAAISTEPTFNQKVEENTYTHASTLHPPLPPLYTANSDRLAMCTFTRTNTHTRTYGGGYEWRGMEMLLFEQIRFQTSFEAGKWIGLTEREGKLIPRSRTWYWKRPSTDCTVFETRDSEAESVSRGA